MRQLLSRTFLLPTPKKEEKNALNQTVNIYIALIYKVYFCGTSVANWFYATPVCPILTAAGSEPEISALLKKRVGAMKEMPEISVMRCPICSGRPAHIYVCVGCGEVRCGQNSCTGSENGHEGWAGSGTLCRHCGQGRYRVMSFQSSEYSDFVREYSFRKRDQQAMDQDMGKAASVQDELLQRLKRPATRSGSSRR
ncbi:hypothetical protein [Magnetococcus sp. PR-3]|uniref:hypothetical protein n=1 Tax=Magnetococcus sp. PR-3 TaxID=3120355 RepID=UPI002FCDE724